MNTFQKKGSHQAARKKFLELSLESTRKSYYPQLQRQLENAKEDQKRLQLLIDNLPAQISYVDLKERYVFVNREFEKSINMERDQIIGQKMEKILGPTNYEKVKSYIEHALSGESGHFEFTFRTKRKAKKWYDINYVAEIDIQERVSGFYVFTIDLTEKKRAEEERLRLKDRLRQAEKMEAIGTLSGGIAHDFNNILSGIYGYSQLVDSYINEPNRAKEYNKKIFEGAQRASSLIQQILSFSRQTQYSKQPISLLIILKEVLNLLRSTIPSNIEIKTNFNSKAMVLVDPTQIHQVIMNLCTNAYHAIGVTGGVMTISLDEVKKQSKKEILNPDFPVHEYLRLSISDTGPGIEDNIIEKIFDPYFTTKKRGRGTGLGLAVVAGIVKKHNGFIEVNTELGTGTTFEIFLPVIKKNHKHSLGSKKGPEDLLTGSERIMLVDDEPAILDTLKEILSRRGYQVSIFENGDSALKSFSENPNQFDLIVTDMTMPKMTGDKLSLEALKIKADISIIICTGYHETFTEADATEIGIKKYFSKPLAGLELLKAIRDIFDNKQQV